MGNGNEWYERYQKTRSLIKPYMFGKHLMDGGTDVTGHDVYAKPAGDDHQTRYDVVLGWQGNYWHATCKIDGTLMNVDHQVTTDDLMMRDFYAGKAGKALDVGCNTG